MNLRTWMLITAVLFIVTGLAMLFFAPSVIQALGIPADLSADITPAADNVYIWNTFVFTRLFGTMLLTIAALLVLVRGSVTRYGRRRMALAMFIGLGAAAAVTFVQQLQIWQSTGGWIMTILLAALAAGYAYWVFFPGMILPGPEEIIEMERHDDRPPRRPSGVQ